MRHLLYLTGLLIVTSCTYSTFNIDRDLEECAPLIYADPARAFERLNGYDISQFDDSALMARWAILYSEALVANRFTPPTDTIIDIAIDYYGSHNLHDEYNKATCLKELLTSTDSTDMLASALYIQKEKEFFLYKERARRHQLLLICLIVIALAAGTIIWLFQRLKLKSAQNMALVADAAALNSELLHNASLCSDLHSKLYKMPGNRFDIIDQLCSTFYESQGTKSERKAIAEKVKSKIEELKSDSGLFAEMEKCVNECRDCLLDNLKKAYPAIKDDDYRLAVYLACNLSNRSIAALTGENMDVVYKRKSRLKSKLQVITADHSGNFMSIFGH